MKKLLLIGIGAVVTVAIVVLWFFSRDTVDLSAYQHLKEPHIHSMPDQKVIECVVKGDPGETAGNAIGKLYKTYYKLPEHPAAAPRARWSNVDKGKDNFIGRHAIPVSNTIMQLPDGTDEDIKLTTWEYGDVAEILHSGSYDSEEVTINRLMTFVKNNGYEVVGDHEEEYLVGPGMFGMKSPKKYQTIIRYRVKQIEPKR